MSAQHLLISTMKNEGPYLLEWVAWRRLIGFGAILVTNDCEDGTDAMLDRLTTLGLARHERNKVLRRGPQKSALTHALAHELTQAADWLYVTDADEFLKNYVEDGTVLAKIATLLARPDIAALRAELLAVIGAGEHFGRHEPKSPAVSRDAAPAERRIAAPCAELRAFLDRVERRAAATETAARLDEIERGLFGALRR